MAETDMAPSVEEVVVAEGLSNEDEVRKVEVMVGRRGGEEETEVEEEEEEEAAILEIVVVVVVSAAVVDVIVGLE